MEQSGQAQASEPSRLVRLAADEEFVLLEGEGLLAAVKAPGVAMIAARGEPPEACLQRRLEERLGQRLFVVHRIDRAASGVVLFATAAAPHRELSLAFEHRRVRKTYLAFVAGTLAQAAGRLDLPLRAARKGKTRPAAPGEAGRASVTEYRTRKTWSLGPEQVSLLELQPLTGRHHQLRVHLRSADSPILFDPLYGLGRMPAALAGAPCARLALHALRLDVPAPRGAGRVVVESPLAADLVALEDWLGSEERTAPGA
jgi:23S rRNA-/tRNA-specific pseudouridylate synthase